MKNQTQHPENIKDVYPENYHLNFNAKTNRMKSSIASTGDEGKRKAIEHTDNLNIFLIQNKGKGPPGRQRSPGAIKANRFSKPVSFNRAIFINSSTQSLPSKLMFGNANTNDFETLTNKKNDDYNVYKFNFIQLLNSIFMKKQLLFLVLFVLALVVSTNTVYGQLAPSTKPITPLSCVGTSEPLHPFPGVPYTYALDGTKGTETAKTYTWWATQDPDFITGKVNITGMVNTNFSTKLGSPDILNPSATYGATTAAPGGSSVQITWSADMLAKTKWHATTTDAPKKSTFVVGYAEGNNCADNIQVFEINPMPNFLVAIAPIDPADNTTSLGWGSTTPTTCVDVVNSAKYNTGTFQIDMDYGTNTLYYEVAASNFVKNWTPTFQIISGLLTTQEAVISIYSKLSDAKTGTGPLWTSSSLKVGDMNTAIATATKLTAATSSDAATGVSVYVKVVISNKTQESLADNPFVLAVDAKDNDETGIWDMEDADCATLDDKADQVDRATITVKPRPQLDDATTPETITNDDAPVVKKP